MKPHLSNLGMTPLIQEQVFGLFLISLSHLPRKTPPPSTLGVPPALRMRRVGEKDDQSGVNRCSTSRSGMLNVGGGWKGYKIG